MAFNKPNKRRIFLSSNKIDYLKIFSFVQEEDGDIYCHWPNFNQTKWITVSNTENQLIAEISDTPNNSKKLSLHRSGVVKFKQNDSSPDSTRIKGSHLINFEKNEVGARHLFTSFINEPKDSSENSPFGNRPSDIPIYSNTFNPFVLMFFAIPQQPIPLQIHLKTQFNIDLFENKTPNAGFGTFSLAYHDILWFAYSTKNMGKWPKYSHIFFHDGFLVPIFLGQSVDIESKTASMNIALQEPIYELVGNNFYLTLPFPQIE